MNLILVGLLMNALDLATGLIAALKNRSLMSEKLRGGLFKKSGFIVCYALAYIIDYVGDNIGLNFPVDVLPAVIGYAFLTEFVSIIENIHKLNEDLLPSKIMSLFGIKDGKKE